ncbi:hypothetical protein N7532_006868 [Penicillium argentinense]|uniref:MARVEL domain-containing protein n=1 Tax=Penicillium argentinense TaxID=1131581 RepID=A0A9W9FGP8_9EURO|nr:uncharacterized protein N7532_006868 [Penicillium argentinense]KAJ5099867.1 hypothetical protein N7532_006868 [Penicillium argentinense]
MANFRIPRPSGGNLGRTKNLIHFTQALIIFVAWAMTIAIWTKGKGDTGGAIDGRTVWYWILCWISVPALVYLAAVPMWPRARRFGNVYAFATVDIIYAVFWFSAWICLASYVAQGKSIGKSSDSDSKNSKDSSSGGGSSGSSSNNKRASSDSNSSSSKGGCDNWAYGNASKCNISTATTIIGVVIFILFAITAWMSFRNVMHFRRTGTLPDAVSDPTFAAQSKAAFSSNPPHDFEEDEEDFRSGRGGGMAAPSRGDQDEDYALLQQSEADDLGGRSAMHGAYDPTGPASSSVLHDYGNTSYTGAESSFGGTNTSYGGRNTSYGGSQAAQMPYSPSEYSTTMSGYPR